jgi:hypothetical protein
MDFLAQLTKPTLLLHRFLALQIYYCYYCYFIFVSYYAVT